MAIKFYRMRSDKPVFSGKVYAGDVVDDVGKEPDKLRSLLDARDLSPENERQLAARFNGPVFRAVFVEDDLDVDRDPAADMRES